VRPGADGQRRNRPVPHKGDEGGLLHECHAGSSPRLTCQHRHASGLSRTPAIRGILSLLVALRPAESLPAACGRACPQPPSSGSSAVSECSAVHPRSRCRDRLHSRGTADVMQADIWYTATDLARESFMAIIRSRRAVPLLALCLLLLRRLTDRPPRPRRSPRIHSSRCAAASRPTGASQSSTSSSNAGRTGLPCAAMVESAAAREAALAVLRAAARPSSVMDPVLRTPSSADRDARHRPSQRGERAGQAGPFGRAGVRRPRWDGRSAS